MRGGLRLQVVLTQVAVAGLAIGLLLPVVLTAVGTAQRTAAAAEARRTAAVLAAAVADACEPPTAACAAEVLGRAGAGRLTPSARAEAVPVPGAPFGVRVDPTPPDLRQVRSFLIGFLVLDLIVVVLAGTLLLVRGLVRPVEALADRADRIARLELAPLPSGTELGRLGTSFRRMVEALGEERARVQRQIEELEAANASLKEAQEGLVRSEKLATVGRLSAGVAHEIGNPLGGLLGYLELLKARVPDDDRNRELITGALDAARRIDATIRDLLDFSRGAPVDRQPFPLEPALDEALRLVRTQKRFAEVDVETHLEADLPYVLADRRRLVQVLVNLFLNAADAMEGRGRLRLAARRTAAGVELAVTDTGPGLPPGREEEIFEPFFTTKPPGRGTGLGLATSRRLVEGWGGRIEAASPPGGGARFTVSLPAAE